MVILAIKAPVHYMLVWGSVRFPLSSVFGGGVHGIMILILKKKKGDVGRVFGGFQEGFCRCLHRI